MPAQTDSLYCNRLAERSSKAARQEKNRLCQASELERQESRHSCFEASV